MSEARQQRLFESFDCLGDGHDVVYIVREGFAAIELVSAPGFGLQSQIDYAGITEDKINDEGANVLDDLGRQIEQVNLLAMDETGLKQGRLKRLACIASTSAHV